MIGNKLVKKSYEDFEKEEIKEEISSNKIITFMYTVLKRLIDIIAGIIGTIILIPLVIVIKIIFLIHGDKESIFFTQKRIGINGKTFTLYKFRTMVMDADKVLKKILEENAEMREEYNINKKLYDDPRVTNIGKILRKTSLDEWPQFFNILKGDMSLIGNRPYLPREVKDMEPYYDNIIKTKPGLTGLWQVSGRNAMSFNERLKLEAEYSKEQNIVLDIKILFKTFLRLVDRKGAK